MNTISYITQHLIYPLRPRAKSLHNEVKSGEGKVDDGVGVTENDVADGKLKTTANVEKQENSTLKEELLDRQGSDAEKASKPIIVINDGDILNENILHQKVWNVLVFVIFFLPTYLIYKPLLLLWFLVTLPLALVERGIKLRNRPKMKTEKVSELVLSDPSKLGSINEEVEEDLAAGDEFYLQRDIVKGSLLKATTNKHHTPLKSKKNSAQNQHGNETHPNSTVFGTKKMGRFLFPKKLIPKSILNREKKKTLVMDLDETLIHSVSRGTTHPNSSQGHIVEVKFSISGVSTLYYVFKRPYCDLFLTKVSKWYDIVIFTASMKEYADPVIDWLESSFAGKFSRRLYRNDCILRDGVGYIKDLKMVTRGSNLGTSPDRLEDVIIVDNSPVSYALNVDNAIQVEGWINDPTDTDLLNLIPLLEALENTTDVRNILSLKNGEKAFNID
ncbi:Nem1-Spo7 phosphatase catalytic subunit NEM1 KNAG_0C05850 [Huiozyma naganishii CBS 8797]|uniref:FCP1 homology domain-containing protein n=1 Tax=Huiozyma naganishii (strain ATCC MYA-139 / BCRC 22969 / CBS 8797 / KCTC 17520 / NBRC 10181 / NCYC 3082 / Yp74L-3) TaxID=1071383 RepID=J7RJI9_HUIN7|nr:hypothetical protein KNAG_0C05850 [Kazachstania naganishii CBS 8797]CCK69683.1 hypothetical protein KNAG_0C05850 [Kazachstania naganishii CBS 8797]